MYIIEIIVINIIFNVEIFCYLEIWSWKILFFEKYEKEILIEGILKIYVWCFCYIFYYNEWYVYVFVSKVSFVELIVKVINYIV